MALTPYLFRDMLSNDWYRPSRLMDQHFGLGLLPEDILEPLTIQPFNVNSYLQQFQPYLSALANLEKGSTVSADKDKFQVSLDVQQFSPDEITVKTVDDDTIIVEGKHEEKQDEHGFISREFKRRYVLPPGHDIKNVQSNLSTDGVLTISAPKLAIEEKSKERSIPILRTGPVKTIKNKFRKATKKSKEQEEKKK